MAKSLRKYLLVVAVILLPFASCSREVGPFDDRVREALTDRLEQYDIKGASAAIVMPDGSVHRICAGFSHDSVQMQPEMLFATGSITKNLVASLVLQLAEEGKLSLNDRPTKWLPSHPYIDSTITLRQMLGHTSGIFMFWNNQKLWDDLIMYRDSVFTPEVILTYLKEPHFAPGRGFRYSNTNYLLLAMIVTKAAGSSLSAQLRKRLWQPLGFQHSYLSMEDSIPRGQLAHVWGDNFVKDGPVRDLTFLPRESHESITYGSSGVFTTAEELAVWCSSLFGGKVLKQASLDEMLKFNTAASSSWCDSYGLGVFTFTKKIRDGVTAYGHGGGNIGTSAYMAYLPDYGVSIVVMINSMHGTCPDRMLGDLIDIVKDEFRDKAEM